jgi:transposase
MRQIRRFEEVGFLARHSLSRSEDGTEIRVDEGAGSKDCETYRRAMRQKFSAEEKLRIVLEGLRGEESIADLCHREGIVENHYNRWSKDFLGCQGATEWGQGDSKNRTRKGVTSATNQILSMNTPSRRSQDAFFE